MPLIAFIDANLPPWLNHQKLEDLIREMELFNIEMNRISDQNDEYEIWENLRKFLEQEPLLAEKTNHFN